MLLVKLKNFFFSTALLDLSSITRHVIALANVYDRNALDGFDCGFYPNN